MTGLERARRRRRNRAVTVLVLAGVLVLGGFGMALAYWSGWGSTDDEPVCTPTTSTPPQAKFTVSVYNSSNRSGAAEKLSQSLRSRGFSLGSVGNDPYKKKLGDSPGEIRYGSEGKALAERYIVPLLPDAKRVEDGRTGTSVDVAIGGYTKSVPAVSETSDAGGC